MTDVSLFIIYTKSLDCLVGFLLAKDNYSSPLPLCFLKSSVLCFSGFNGLYIDQKCVQSLPCLCQFPKPFFWQRYVSQIWPNTHLNTINNWMNKWSSPGQTVSLFFCKITSCSIMHSMIPLKIRNSRFITKVDKSLGSQTTAVHHLQKWYNGEWGTCIVCFEL